MRRQNLNRYRALQAGVQCAVNFPHSASAQRRLYFIGTELRARGEAHLCRVIIASSQRIEASLAKSGIRIQVLFRLTVYRPIVEEHPMSIRTSVGLATVATLLLE